MEDAINHPPESMGALPAAGPVTLLVIDDDPAMRSILSFSLKTFGYLVLVAGNGEEALQIARDHPEIRLIILDVVMSGLSGKKLAGQLKVNRPESSILFCSGHPLAVLLSLDIDLQGEHFLKKPYGMPELRQKIEELLATR